MTYMCSNCGHLSDRKDNMTKHINKKKNCGNETGNIVRVFSEIQCEHCLKKFASKQNLVYHLKNVCKKPFEQKRKNIKKRNNYGNSKNISDVIYNKILITKEVYQIIPHLIKQIHFDPDIPENHNIYISGKNSKNVQFYKNNQWISEERDHSLENIINDIHILLENWIKQKGDKYPRALRKFKEYIDQRYEEETSKIIREQAELLMYNGRYIVKEKEE